MHSQLVTNLFEFSEGALALAEQAVAQRDQATSKVAALEQNQITLQKVASVSTIDKTLETMAAGGLVPPSNRQKLASLLATHEGALEVVNALVFQSFSPSIGGEPVAQTVKTASATGDSGDTGGEMAMFAKLARDGFN